MKKLKYIEIREKYLQHLKEKYDHAIIPSASLITEDDPTLLFTNSGMVPLVPYLLGESHPEGKRLGNSQRCVRTIDIDSVGDKTHLTTFEMLGNWSLNDYFKTEAIGITLSFFTEELGIPLEKLYVSVFEGEGDIPEDKESIEAYKKIYGDAGLDHEVGPMKRIHPYGKKENWWGLPSGGPSGPNSEIFFDTGLDYCGDDCGVACDCDKFVELGNNVFMEYSKEGDEIKPLGRHNVDFGAGLDRLAMISQGHDNVYQVDVYKPIYDKVVSLAKEMNEESVRIVVDHIKAATWMLMDGVQPGRNEREYVLRMLIRRAIRHGRRLGIEGSFTKEVGEIVIDNFGEVIKKLDRRKEGILSGLEVEEEKFNKTLQNGLREVEKIISSLGKKTFENKESESFRLFETHGFPVEMLIEELVNKGVSVDEEKVMENHNKAFEKHQETSRAGAAGRFKGGLADTSEESTKLHTATHLLLAALREVVGDHIYQKGSNITPERLRLDFPNDEKLTPEQINAVEKLINDKIAQGLDVSWEELPKKEALEKVPFAAFDDKYGDTVKLYSIGDFSTEICGGPHVENTSNLGTFKITKQESVGAGVKRIKAVLEG